MKLMLKLPLVTGLLMITLACSGTREVNYTVVESTLTPDQTARLMGPAMMPLETYQRAEKLLSWNVTGLIQNQVQSATWISPEHFWYRTSTESGDVFFLVDVTDTQRTPAFDHADLAEKLSASTGKSFSAGTLPMNRIEFSTDRTTISFTAERQNWTYHRGSGTLTKVDLIDSPAASNVSPDGSKAVYIKEFNLWMRNMQTGQDTQLTTDGAEYFGYATNSQGWSRSAAPIVAWSPDSRKISTYRLDERGVELMYLLETAAPRVKLHAWPYALPGDSIVPLHQRVLIDTNDRSLTWLNTPPDQQRTSNCCGLTRGTSWADNEFSADASKLAFVSTSRDYKTVTLKVADTRTGAVREVYTESSAPYTFESNLTSRGIPNWRVFHDTNEFIWFTRADDWGHLYLRDLSTGNLKNRITQGEWNVIDILHIDTRSRTIWFTGVGREVGRDVYQTYLYKVGFDGSGLTLLTPEEGNHDITFSPDGSYFVDTWSDFQNPHTSVVRDLNGTVMMQLGKADISKLLATGWTAPEPFVAKGRDGTTDVYGIMFKPSNFDPSRSYPIINSIYPGPQGGSIGTRSFSPSVSGQARALAELGFIVVKIDAFGSSPERSRTFHTAYVGDMADNGLPDQRAAMIQLAQKHSFIDINRVGIFGHSGGGFATAAALLTHPDFFKVGVSSAGNIDNRGYTYYWGEKYQGLLTKNPDGTDNYTNQSLPLKAENLQGKLLISYGTLDSNVHPNMALLLVNELIRADKDFDLMVMPNRGHGYFNEVFNVRRTWDYFIEHLLETKPNPDFRIQRN
jgi:dipeptidyl-peptidase 4